MGMGLSLWSLIPEQSAGLRFAIARGNAEHDVTTTLKGALKPPAGRHFEALTKPQDVADLMTRIEVYHGSLVVRGELCFSLYTLPFSAQARYTMQKASPCQRIR